MSIHLCIYTNCVAICPVAVGMEYYGDFIWHAETLHIIAITSQQLHIRFPVSQTHSVKFLCIVN